MRTIAPGAPRVIVPFTEDMHPTVEDAIRQQGVAAEFVFVGHSDEDYHRLLRGLWEAGEDFIIVEHDVLPWFGSLRELWNCRKSWCTVPTLIVNQDLHGRCLGLARFKGKVAREHPHMFDAITDPYWGRQDTQMARELHEIGLSAHIHQPPALHMHTSHFKMGEKLGLKGLFPPIARTGPVEYFENREQDWPPPHRRLIAITKPIHQNRDPWGDRDGS